MINKIKELFQKYKTVIAYLFFGVCTTVVNWIAYIAFMFLLGNFIADSNVNIIISNVIAWIFAVIFALIINKLWVFDSKSFEKKKLFYEIWTFVSARLVTLLIETGILYLAALIFGSDNNIVNIIWKIITSVIVVVLNYIFSKLIIFRKKEENPEENRENS